MRSFCVAVFAMSLAPVFAQDAGGTTGATTGTAQGNQAVQGQQIDAPQITGPEFSFGDAAENGGQSAFQSRETTAFGNNATSQSGGRGATRTFNTAGRGGTGRTTSSTSTRTRQVRPTFRLGFVPSQALSALNIGARAKQRVASVKSRVKQLSGVNVNASQTKGVVTLRGSVRSESAKRLAAALLRLEPGVRKVQNQIQVADASSVKPGVPPKPPAPSAARPRQ